MTTPVPQRAPLATIVSGPLDPRPSIGEPLPFSICPKSGRGRIDKLNASATSHICFIPISLLPSKAVCVVAIRYTTRVRRSTRKITGFPGFPGSPRLLDGRYHFLQLTPDGPRDRGSPPRGRRKDSTESCRHGTASPRTARTIRATTNVRTANVGIVIDIVLLFCQLTVCTAWSRGTPTAARRLFSHPAV